MDYWKRRIAELPPPPTLPMKSDPSTLKEIRFRHAEQRLTSDSWRRLKQRAGERGLTPTGVILAAFSEVIGRWSASARFTLNITLFNRLPVHPRVNEIIGDFTSMVLLDIDTARDESFDQRAKRIQQQLWEAMDHRDVSGIEVQREAARVLGMRRGALFPVVLTSALNQQVDGISSLRRLGTPVYAVTQTPQLLLDHQLYEQDGALVLMWDIVQDVYPDELLSDMFHAYEQLLRNLADGDGAWTEAPPVLLLPPAQRSKRESANATEGPIPEELIHEMFMRKAAAHPNSPAVITSSRVLTYKDVDRLSNRLSRRLRAAGVRPDHLVPIVMEKGWEQVVAVYGVLKAGGAYVPVDASSPEHRLRFLIQNSEASVVLTQSKYVHGLSWLDGPALISVDESEAGGDDDLPLESVQGPHDLAYVLYTSGSTGQPKGAMIEHRSVMNRMSEVAERFGLRAEDRALALSALHHDLSVFDLFCVLSLVGGAIVLPDADRVRDPAHWAELMREHRVTLWNSVPAFMQMLVEHLEDATSRGEPVPASLRWVILSGDFIPVALPDRLRSLISGVAVIGAGGPTETTVWDICYPIEEVDAAWNSIPYGRPMRNATYRVLNESLEECPEWVPGELFIGGVGLARGYFRDDERTRASFILHPRTGERLYRSGDLGRWLPDGNIEILGRRDLQVKIRGHRIEPGEIEEVLKQHAGVRDAVVLATGDSAVNKHLLAFVVRRGEREPARSASPDAGAVAPGALVARAGGLSDSEKVEFKLARHGLRSDRNRAPVIGLPRPDPREAALESYARRRSVRTFLEETISSSDFGRFLSCLSSVEPDGAALPKFRYPSAGSTYPVQTYVYVKADRIEGVDEGFYYYHPREHHLLKLSSHELERGAHVPQNVGVFDEAAFGLLFVGKLDAIEPLYGSSARDFCVLEAGYMGQLLMEHAPSCNIGVCPVGQFDFEQVRPALDLGRSDVYVHGMLGGRVDPRQYQVCTLGQESSPRRVSTRGAPPGHEERFADLLRDFLRTKLPEYMVPSAFVELDALPLTSNGKVDRKALRERRDTSSQQPSEHMAPRDALEEILVAVVREALGLEVVGLQQSFSELGATSIHIVRMRSLLQKRLDREIAITELFQYPSIGALASGLRRGSRDSIQRPSMQDRLDARRRGRRRG
ncbi:hypothetical protein BE21_56455 [Sorangium cellulosum]|uniref:Carrier domain-containing protein n=1 Tax=Sorangium cellulosum TaxID=56 RepID=A0A150TA25_SORCE|nr:hypothetical protein BE21_56455 [Sorangium cellulosum]